MHFIFSTGSLYSYSIDRCFEFAQRAGFDGVELLIDQRWDTRQADYVARLVERYDQPVRAVHSPFISNLGGWSRDLAGGIEKSVSVAEALGASVVILHLPEKVSYSVVQIGGRRILLPLPGMRRHEQYIRWVQEGMPRLQEQTDVFLAIENMPARQAWGRRINAIKWNAHDRASISDITRFPHITMDTTHLGTWGLDPAEIYFRWRDRVKHVHLSNFNGREHRRPEDGHLRLDQLLARLAQFNYSHAVSLELHPDALSAGSADDGIVARLKASLDQCRQWANANV